MVGSGRGGLVGAELDNVRRWRASVVISVFHAAVVAAAIRARFSHVEIHRLTFRDIFGFFCTSLPLDPLPLLFADVPEVVAPFIVTTICLALGSVTLTAALSLVLLACGFASTVDISMFRSASNAPLQSHPAFL